MRGKQDVVATVTLCAVWWRNTMMSDSVILCNFVDKIKNWYSLNREYKKNMAIDEHCCIRNCSTCSSSLPVIILSTSFILLMPTATDRVTGCQRSCHPAAPQEAHEGNAFIPRLSAWTCNSFFPFVIPLLPDALTVVKSSRAAES